MHSPFEQAIQAGAEFRGVPVSVNRAFNLPAIALDSALRQILTHGTNARIDLEHKGLEHSCHASPGLGGDSTGLGDPEFDVPVGRVLERLSLDLL
jgi:hypothetical protein